MHCQDSVELDPRNSSRRALRRSRALPRSTSGKRAAPQIVANIQSPQTPHSFDALRRVYGLHGQAVIDELNAKMKELVGKSVGVRVEFVDGVRTVTFEETSCGCGGTHVSHAGEIGEVAPSGGL